jgi:MFS transporter, SP family, arabinose:H+ symporter
MFPPSRRIAVCPAGVLGAVAIQATITPDAAVLPFARMLIGLAIGADLAIATAYIAE